MGTKRQLVKEVYIKPCAKVFELAEKSFIMLLALMYALEVMQEAA